MILEKGQHVKCILRNSAVVEGIIEIWTEKQVELKSLDGKSVMIIHHPGDDIVLTKVVLTAVDSCDHVWSSPAKDAPPVTCVNCGTAKIKESEKISEVVRNNFGEVISPYDLSASNSLLKLRQTLADEDRAVVAHKLKTHYPSLVSGKVRYGYPRFFKKRRP